MWGWVYAETPSSNLVIVHVRESVVGSDLMMINPKTIQPFSFINAKKKKKKKKQASF